MQGIYPAEGVADKQVQGVGRVTAVDSLIGTVVYVLAEACFPLIIRGALTVCLVRNERGDRFGRTFLRQVTLVRKTVVEELIRVTHTDILINRVMIDTRHTYGGFQSIYLVRNRATRILITDKMRIMKDCMNLILLEWGTCFRWKMRLIWQYELMFQSVNPVRCSYFIWHSLLNWITTYQCRITRLRSVCHIIYTPFNRRCLLGDGCLYHPFYN